MAIFLFGLFVIAATTNIIYFLSFFSFAGNRSTSFLHPKVPVSVVICAKNEAENLKNFLPAISEQEYPEFEIIVINDASSDDTQNILEDFQKLDPKIKIVKVENNEAFWGSKKYALTLGIKKAKFKHLLFTDADCAPQTQNWITEMSRQFQPGISIVLGYGGYFKHKGSFLNKLIRFETLLTAIQYFSYARLGSPYMGVGRNLAYTSEQFYNQKGFAKHLHLRSGDDDLFVNEAATVNNTGICYQKDGITRSVPKLSFKEWFAQKQRHVSVAKHYKIKHQILLGLFYVSRLSFWLLLPILLIFQVQFWFVLAILILKFLIEGLVYFKASRKLDENDVFWLFPIFDLFLIIWQFTIFITNLFSKPTHWK